MEHTLTEAQEKEWGLESTDLYLRSGDYGWRISSESTRTYILKDVQRLKGTLNLMKLISMFRNTGHMEWEVSMALFVLLPTIEAINAGKDEADISMLFNRDLLASGGRVFTAEQCREHVSPWFDITEDGDFVYLKFKFASQQLGGLSE